MHQVHQNQGASRTAEVPADLKTVHKLESHNKTMPSKALTITAETHSSGTVSKNPEAMRKHGKL